MGARRALLRIVAVALAVAVLFSTDAGMAMALTLTSSAFQAGRQDSVEIYLRGRRSSRPRLPSRACPRGAKSLALILDDPDAPDPKAPKRVWVHWVVYNLPPDTKSLPENAGSQGLPQGAVTGTNDRKQNAYHGPCPPIGRHRYFHKLYALDIALPPAPLTKVALEAAMQGHVLAQAELMGTYQKGDP